MSPRCLVMASLLLSLPACEDQWPDRSDAPPGPENEDEPDAEEDGEMCIEGCDPVEPECASGQACLPSGNVFACQGVPQSDPQDEPQGAVIRAGLHEPCEVTSQLCDPGLICLPVAVPGCVGSSGCCMSFCDVNRPECDDDTTCVRYFEEGALCHAEVGVCVIE